MWLESKSEVGLVTVSRNCRRKYRVFLQHGQVSLGKYWGIMNCQFSPTFKIALP